MKSKISELTGAALDWAVAKALGTLNEAPSRCCDCYHFEERAIQDGADYRCHLGDLSWCDGYASDDPFGDNSSATYGVHARCPLKAGTATEPYSSKWYQGGPIIEREKLCPCPASTAAGAPWSATDLSGHVTQFGPTPLIAAMRCYVASKLGEEVDVPEEIC